jgi:hypothetical protein
MYSEELHERATIQSVADSFLGQLRGLIAHCMSVVAGADITPELDEIH